MAAEAVIQTRGACNIVIYLQMNGHGDFYRWYAAGGRHEQSANLWRRSGSRARHNLRVDHRTTRAYNNCAAARPVCS